MTQKLTGGCLCGAVRYAVAKDFKGFVLCHCKQCQKLTGSAFASNISSEPGNIEWLAGADSVSAYEHPTREFSKAFCRQCGSALPFVNKSKTSLIIPAGSLDEPPGIEPRANIFCAEEASWYAPGRDAENFTGFPD